MSTKENILKKLKEKQGEWASGEQLSRELGVSRAAVSKHMGTLRKEGYEIKSSSGKGYRLSCLPDRIHPFEIRHGLNTTVFGQQEIACFKQTDSTNIRARELAVNGAPEGTIVIAESQTAGRGRKGRHWFSPVKGGIYMSLVLRPQLSPADAPRITLMTAVALAQALIASTDINIKIKWPNDILTNGKKLSGILTEISTEMDMVDYVIVGVGLNVNMTADKFKGELEDIATSLRIETGMEFDRSTLVRTVLEKFEQTYDLFNTQGFAPIIDRWKTLSGIIGKIITIDVLGKIHKGRVIDVDNSGILITEDENGKQHRFYSGDVTL